MKILVAALVVLLLLCGGLLMNSNARKQAAEAQLAEARAASAALSEQLAEAQGARVNQSELDRLKADQREAIRLRGELTNLKQQVTNANALATAAQRAAAAAAARAGADAGRAAPEAQPLPEPQVFNSQAVANLVPGQSMVVGGWQTGTGSVTYAFITPTVTEGGTNSVTLDAKYVEIPNEAAARMTGLQGSGGQPATLTSEQMTAMLRVWEQTPGFNVISSPRLTTLSGMRGRMTVVETRQTANGPVQFGPQMEIFPTMASDGSQILLDVNASLTVPKPAQ